jgi:hypothetical protein
MNTIHLTEEMLQLVAMEGIEKHPSAGEHFRQCDSCKAHVDFYIQMINKTEAIKPQKFQFDLSSVVMASIPDPKPTYHANKKSISISLVMAIIFITTSMLIYILRKELLRLTNTSSEISLFIIAVSGLTILFLVSWDILREYENKMNKLKHQ